MENENLLEFIAAAKAQGVEDEFVLRLLRQNGWSERAVLRAYSSYYGAALKRPIPVRGAGIENARHAFFYLLAFITLGTWAFALGNLFYVFVDMMLKDPLTASYMADSWRINITYDMAAVIVAFPIFLWMMWIVQHEAMSRPEVLDSGVRKWLTYLSLVITASCLIGDGVAFLQQFLNGSLSEAFVLKSLVLITIAGGIFVYYLGAVRAEAATVRRDQVFAVIAAAAVLFGISMGFIQNGAPAARRNSAFDELRLENLREISNAVNAAWNENHKHALPSSLQPLFDTATPLRDPQTAKPYTYRILGGSRYQLCAAFDTSTMTNSDGSIWNHPAGNFCFTRDAGRRLHS